MPDAKEEKPETKEHKLKQRLDAEKDKGRRLRDQLAGLENKIERQATHIATLEGGAKPYKERCKELAKTVEDLREENRKLKEQNEQLTAGLGQIHGKIAEKVYEAEKKAEAGAPPVEDRHPDEAGAELPGGHSVQPDSPPPPSPAPSLADEL